MQITKLKIEHALALETRRLFCFLSHLRLVASRSLFVLLILILKYILELSYIKINKIIISRDL